MRKNELNCKDEVKSRNNHHDGEFGNRSLADGLVFDEMNWETSLTCDDEHLMCMLGMPW